MLLDASGIRTNIVELGENRTWWYNNWFNYFDADNIYLDWN